MIEADRIISATAKLDEDVIDRVNKWKFSLKRHNYVRMPWIIC